MASRELELAVNKWINDNPNILRRSARAYLSFYHNTLPREFRIFGALHVTTKTAMASSAPALAYFVYESITAWMAMFASMGVFVGHFLVGVLNRVSKENRSSRSSDQTESIVRVGDLLRMCAPISTAQANRDDMVRSALGIVENFTRQVTNSRKGEISVSIALYNGSGTGRMSIRHRNPGNTRPIGRSFRTEGVLGHHACQHGAGPKIVHNIKRMNKIFRKSPTNSDVVYKSFLLFPLTLEKQGTATVGGFLSIDSTRPYTFHGSRGNVLVVNCEPIVEHIQKLL